MQSKIAKVGDAKDVVCEQYSIAVRYVKAKYLVEARIMAPGLIKSVLKRRDGTTSKFTQLVLEQRLVLVLQLVWEQKQVWVFQLVW